MADNNSTGPPGPENLKPRTNVTGGPGGATRWASFLHRNADTISKLKTGLRYSLKAGRITWTVSKVAVGAFLVYKGYTAIANPVLVADNTVLKLKLDKNFFLGQESSLFQFVLPTVRKFVLYDLLNAIDSASRDPKIKGIIAKIDDDVAFGLADIEELRDAIDRFNKEKNFSIAFSTNLSSGNRYLFATMFNKIYLQPLSYVGVNNIHQTHTFFKGTLHHLGIIPIIFKKREYKSFLDPFVHDKHTPEVTEAFKHLLELLYGATAASIARARMIDEDKINEILLKEQFLSGEALKLGLIDKEAHWDTVISEANNLFSQPQPQPLSTAQQKLQQLLQLQLHRDNKVHFMDMKKYMRYAKTLRTRAQNLLFFTRTSMPRVAVTHYTGMVEKHAADLFCHIMKQAIKDDSVKVIVVRVDSAGGDVVASETLRRQIERAQEAGKKVYVSMGNVCASGGYYMSMGGDKIFANPSTVTGSIGIATAVTVLRDLAHKLGVTTQSISVDGAQPYPEHVSLEYPSQTAIARMDADVEAIYNHFVAAAAKARKMPFEQMEQIARGRVWTGAEAKAVGLVDELGGIQAAIKAAKQHIRDEIQKPDLPVLDFEVSESQDHMLKRFVQLWQLEHKQTRALMTGLSYMYSQFKSELGSGSGSGSGFTARFESPDLSEFDAYQKNKDY